MAIGTTYFEKYSYSAANVFPVKLFLNKKLNEHINSKGKIPITHIQLNPTNRCNRNCPFCSCSSRDKELELPYKNILDVMGKAKMCGCQSVTITGGGEPLMHPDINDIITGISKMGIEVGMVTNGDLIKNLNEDALKSLVWCRVSVSDYGRLDKGYLDGIREVVNSKAGLSVDWAFSYVVTRFPDFEKIEKVIKFADDNDFTHVRLVSDLLDLDDVPDMKAIKNRIIEMGIDDGFVNYQGRREFTAGNEYCLISLLKPVIGADGYVYPCCGTQYALKEPTRDYEKSMRMCRMEDIVKLYEEQSCFNGSVCAKCYYGDYNTALILLTSMMMEHVKFV